jgi:hypothetical protein
MNQEALMNMLLSMRAQIDAALFLLQKDGQGCEHKNLLNLSTMGGPEKWICKDCNFEYTGEE